MLRVTCIDSSHAVTSDITAVETAKSAVFFKTDAVVITGAATGEEADPVQLHGKKT